MHIVSSNLGNDQDEWRLSIYAVSIYYYMTIASNPQKRHSVRKSIQMPVDQPHTLTNTFHHFYTQFQKEHPMTMETIEHVWSQAPRIASRAFILPGHFSLSQHTYSVYQNDIVKSVQKMLSSFVYRLCVVCTIRHLIGSSYI